jgi:6,7-dimethyl-8-ribityllumazine synthase
MEALPFGPQPYSGHLCHLPDRDVRVVGYHARPDAKPRAGLVIATDIGGVRPLFTDMCDRLASHGISAVAVEPFDRIPDVQDKAPTDRLLDVSRLRDVDQVGDLVTAADELRTWDGVAKVSILGFCMGGMYALKAAATGRFDAVVARGCVIRGETYHFEVVSDRSSQGVMQVSLEYGMPIANAILTVDTDEQAHARTREKGADAARVAIEMANLGASLASLAPDDDDDE